jgi:hypothetical protein
MNVNNKVMDSLCIGVREVVRKAVEECALTYKFDSEEALSRLGLNEVCLSMKKVEKKSKKVVKVAFPLPFNGVKDDNCCSALKLNHGLYTQCENKCGPTGEYCKGCSKQASKSESGKPEYGTIDDRIAVGMMEFRDPKGKSPIAYTKIMKKMNLSKEQVLEEAGKLNVVVAEEHFAMQEESKKGRPKSEKPEKVEKEDKKKGRPAKAKKVLEVQEETSDLFAEMIAAASTTAKEVVVEEKAKKEEEKALKEQGKAEKKALKEQKEAEKAKKEQEKAEEKAKKEQEKAEEKAKKEQEKAKKEQEKAEKKGVKEEKGEKKAKEEEEQDVVKKFEYEGTKFLKSKKTGIVYNMEQDVVGKWDEASKKIIFDEAESDDEEESEEEYEE